MKICALILAAGKSERMGQLKPLLPFNKEENFIQHIISTIRQAGVPNIWVVIGAHAEKIIPVLPQDVNCVVNEEFEQGQLSSIQKGLSEIMKEDFDGVIITLVDHPLIENETYRTITQNAENLRDTILIACYNGRKGHPVFIPRKYFDEVLRAPLDVGLRHVTNNPKNYVFLIDTKDKGVIIDIDTPDLYKTHIGGNR